MSSDRPMDAPTPEEGAQRRYFISRTDFETSDNTHIFQRDALEKVIDDGVLDLTDTEGNTHKYTVVKPLGADDDDDQEDDTQDGDGDGGSDHGDDPEQPDPSLECPAFAGMKRSSVLSALKKWRFALFGLTRPLPLLARHHTWNLEQNKHLLDGEGKVAFPHPGIEDEGLTVVDTKGDRFFVPLILHHRSQAWDDGLRAKAIMDIIEALFRDTVTLSIPEDLSPVAKRRIRRLQKHKAWQKRNRGPPLTQNQSGLDNSATEQDRQKRSASEMNEEFWKAVEEVRSGALTVRQAVSKYETVSLGYLTPFAVRPDAEDLHRRRLLAFEDIKSGFSVFKAYKRNRLSAKDLDWFRRRELAHDPDLELRNIGAAIAAVLTENMSPVDAAKKYKIKHKVLRRQIHPLKVWKHEVEQVRRAKAAAADVDKGVMSLKEAEEVYKMRKATIAIYLAQPRTAGDMQAKKEERQKRIKLAAADCEAGNLSIKEAIEKYNVKREDIWAQSSIPQWRRPKPESESGPSNQ
ncbi:uncharacterized protein CCOS01_08486 [Colletotrichum costaricense]|uniref:Uncharacterized protein n=1 Tax=Colletotrichum costaricense TaxID=1209916 RepID=A0AAI9YWM8_9PEZI|nr:uncharacterized protein CCOS01_08486 [Colletotrichum costaricense]KAK1526068.1 hypothetical protein CCOS01_08486 [Colletotrichum costaricense]